MVLINTCDLCVVKPHTSSSYIWWPSVMIFFYQGFISQGRSRHKPQIQKKKKNHQFVSQILYLLVMIHTSNNGSVYIVKTSRWWPLSLSRARHLGNKLSTTIKLYARHYLVRIPMTVQLYSTISIHWKPCSRRNTTRADERTNTAALYCTVSLRRAYKLGKNNSNINKP